MPDDVKPTTALESNPRIRIGGNAPPPQEQFREINEGLPGYLENTYAKTFKRAEDLIEAFGRMPEAIDSEELAGRVSDFAAQITACVKEAEAFRTDLIAGPLAAQRLINTTFDKKIFAELDPDNKRTPGIKQKVLAMLTTWERKKADMERQRRLEEERKAREAAEVAERARLEAERKAREAAEAERRRQEDEARRAREAQEAEQRRIAEEERKAREAAEAEAKAVQNAKDLDEAIRREEEAKIARAKREAEAKVAREKAEAEAKERARVADLAASLARAKAEEERKAAEEQAARAAADAAKAREAAEAKAADLHTVRGDFGSSSSLRSTWKGFITDQAKLLADPQLHPFIAEDAVQKALNNFVRVHKNTKTLAGAEIRLDTGAVVRG